MTFLADFADSVTGYPQASIAISRGSLRVVSGATGATGIFQHADQPSMSAGTRADNTVLRIAPFSN